MYFTNSSLQQDEAAGLGLRAPSPSSRVAHYRSISTDRMAEVAALGGLKGMPDHEGQAAPAHYYGSWTGYCFTVNYILGVGVLGMPYAFYRAGWALSTLTLGFVTVMATLTALWLVDVSLRAQFVKRQLQLMRGGVEAEGVNDMPVSPRVQHRFEVNELVEMFLGLRARRFYELLVIIYLVGALWSYSSVFASSLASHVGIPGISEECNIYKDGSSACNNLYLTYMAMFAVVAVPLTCLDLTEMKAMQIALAVFRFVSLITMMVTSIVAMYSYPNPEPAAHSAATKPYYSDVPAFNWSGLGLMFPISIYAQIFHHSVPGLSHPLKDKRQTPRVFTGVLVTTALLYSALGASVAAYYGDAIPQTCTLAWANYTGHAGEGSKPAWAAFIGYLVVLFPPIDIISAFPLNAITLGNNLLCAFVKDERKQALKRYKLPFRILAALPPLVGAIVVKDLGVILKYTGCVGVLIAFVYPCLLQWRSTQMCVQMGITAPADSSSPLLAEQAAGSDDADADAAKVPTYNLPFVSQPKLVYVVAAFSIVGLVAVIVLSAMGIE